VACLCRLDRAGLPPRSPTSRPASSLEGPTLARIIGSASIFYSTFLESSLSDRVLGALDRISGRHVKLIYGRIRISR
jgi:hypothetical protein